jgi:hypothetical protein
MRSENTADHTTLHGEAIDHVRALGQIVDQLMLMGPHPVDGDNAILNIQERVFDLANRGRARGIPDDAGLTIRGEDVIVTWVLVVARGTGSAGVLRNIYLQLADLDRRRPSRSEAADMLAMAAGTCDSRRMIWVKQIIDMAERGVFTGEHAKLLRRSIS